MTVLFRPWLSVLLIAIFIAAYLLGGQANSVDVSVVQYWRDIRQSSPNLTATAVALTHLGSVYATIGSGLVAAVALLWLRQHRAAALMIAAVISERLIVDGLKLVIGRSRPLFDEHPVLTHSFSFPSGHAANTMAVFVSIALIAAPRQHRSTAVSVAVGASLLIGLTRPLLGVHWPSDVIGGWALGLLIAICAAWLGQKSGAIEAEHVVVGGHRTAIGETETA